MTSATIPDAIYFLHPAGSAWIAAQFRGGVQVARTEECNAGTHAAANDRWAGIVPSDDDIEVGRRESEAITREVMGDKIDPEMVVVARHAS